MTQRHQATQHGVDVKTIQALGAGSRLQARLYTVHEVHEVHEVHDAVRRAKPAPSDRLIVFFPCGGFVDADLDQADCFLRELTARTGMPVVTVAYTTATESPFPAAAEDAHAVLKWAMRNRARLGWSGAGLIVAGIEAGGNLAAAATLMARDRGGPALAGQILIMPMLDPALSSCSMRSAGGDAADEASHCAAAYRSYLRRAIDRLHPYAAPLLASRTRGLPPALVLSAEDDPLCDEAEQYAAKLSAAGIRSTLRRLPPIAFAEPDARCRCARQEAVLDEIAAFVESLHREPGKPVA